MSEPHDPHDLFGGNTFTAPTTEAPRAGRMAVNASAEVPPDKRMKLSGISRVVAAYEVVLSHAQVRVGRTLDNDVVIEHPTVSDFHAHIAWDGKDYVLEDRGSVQGTRVNSERYKRFALQRNDMVQFGDVRFRFMSPSDGVIPEAGSVSLYVRRQPKLTAGRKKALLLGGAGAALAILAVVALLVVGESVGVWMGLTGKKGGADSIEALQARLVAARKLLDADQLSEARAELEQIRALAGDLKNPVAVQAENALDRVRREELARDSIDRVLALRSKGQADEAWALLQEVLPQLPPDTHARKKLVDLQGALRDEAAGTHVAAARRALEAGDKKTAALEAEAALRIDATNVEAKRLRASAVAVASGGGQPDEEVEVEVIERRRGGGIDFSGDTGLVDVRGKAAAPGSRGRLPQEAVEQVVASRQAEIRWCYEQGLRREPTLVGKVVAEWTVNETGRVQNAHTLHSSLKDPEVTACILKKIARWSFPAPTGGDVVVNYPFAFEPKL
jgi:TonB family protein